jgi:tRNA threonylcarbamoyl adenosine modification protein YeaZ
VLLALDTSTPRVAVALWEEGVVDNATSEQTMKHGELLAPMISAALERAGAVRQDVTAVAAGVGPGPYTGLRVGLVTARTLGMALEVPVYGVCTLDVVAAQAAATSPGVPFVATLDARRKELFWATYDEDGARNDGPFVGPPQDVPQDQPVAGAGPVLYPDAFPTVLVPEAPDAGWLAHVVAEELAELVDPEPIYLRRPDAAVPGPAKRVS